MPVVWLRNGHEHKFCKNMWHCFKVTNKRLWRFTAKSCRIHKNVFLHLASAAGRLNSEQVELWEELVRLTCSLTVQNMVTKEIKKTNENQRGAECHPSRVWDSLRKVSLEGEAIVLLVLLRKCPPPLRSERFSLFLWCWRDFLQHSVHPVCLSTKKTESPCWRKDGLDEEMGGAAKCGQFCQKN